MKAKKAEIVEIIRSRKLGVSIIGQWWNDGNDLLLLSELNGNTLEFDGLTSLARRDVRSVSKRFEGKAFYKAIADYHKTSMTKQLESLTRCNDMITLAQQLKAKRKLIAVALEHVSADHYFVGFVVSVFGKSFILNTISALGEFNSSYQEVLLRSVTKIEIDTRYLQSLERFVRRSHKTRI